MRPATKRLLSVLVSLAFFVGAIVLFSSLVVPEYRVIQQLRGERNSLAAVVKEEEDLVKTASRLLNEYQNSRDIRSNLSLILPIKEVNSGIVNQVQGIAKMTGVAVEGINTEIAPIELQGTSPVVEPVGTLKMIVRLKGSYEGLKSYVQSLETNVRIIDVDSLVIGGGGTRELLQANLTIRTYYQR